MSELSPELAADVVAACQAGAKEAADALGRSLDGEFALAVGTTSSWSTAESAEGFAGPGLAVLLKFGDVGFLAILPEVSGMLPPWYKNPDPTGESKLSTLAQELSMLLVPETLMADDFQATYVEDLNAALARSGISEGAGLVTLELTSGEKAGQLSLVWPLALPGEFFPAKVAEPVFTAPAPVKSTPPFATNLGPASFSQLPSYSRSLLKIQVPVRVVLATKKESIKDVVEVATGTIIKFSKPCDEMLHLYVGDQRVAEGEAVKVGDKFGFRVNAMTLPQEHFVQVRPQQAG